MGTDAPEFFRVDDENALSGRTVVYDEFGIRYVLVTPPWKLDDPQGENRLLPLAEGGQGATYLTENPDVILKFANYDNNFITDPELIENYRRRIRYISTLPLPPESNITIPQTFLKGYAGYRMVFLDGFCSLNDFFYKKDAAQDEERPDYIPAGPSGARLRKYLATGALAHRLEVLGKASVILARLHARGISYGDISLNNIFLPINGSESEAWFIDPDNMVEAGHPVWSQCIGTDPYCAPEICEGGCCDLTSDTFSFAELAFNLLADRHPFHGKAYDTSDLLRQEKSNPRNFAWICDPEDESNRSALFLPVQKLFPRELMRLFWQTFVAGKDDPSARSPMALWPVELFRGLDMLTHCPHCGLSFIAGEDDAACPICRTALEDELLFTVHPAASDRVLWQVRRHIAHDGTTSASVPRRAVAPFEFGDYDSKVLCCVLADGCLTLQKVPMDNCRVIFHYADGHSQELRTERLQLTPDELQSGQLSSEITKFGITVSRRIVCRIIRRRNRQ